MPDMPEPLSAAARGFTMPAEWEEQRAILLSWPLNPATWEDRRAEIETDYAGFAAAVGLISVFCGCVNCPIASVVLAGVSMAGGKGNMLGVIFGALSYTTINFIIVSIPGLSVDIQDTFQGLVLIIVILIQTAGPAIKESFQRSRKRRLASAK